MHRGRRSPKTSPRTLSGLVVCRGEPASTLCITALSLAFSKGPMERGCSRKNAHVIEETTQLALPITPTSTSGSVTAAFVETQRLFETSKQHMLPLKGKMIPLAALVSEKSAHGRGACSGTAWS
ncbi:hypothetical protein CORC01_12754 [Colletotrichum orchidophilum]|uniref:Uncharacterized protein n=1 Tax=Colletotrichum orchidophilum TaxID=1209926 RepID=A0A1G4AS78_9PEZI|nr:uncharacterized protein CORC01_12754 [Colletotrichum orchidophilum]OHE91966.1 hypothetical protein CORC01_12754 [Colletotrichum orchidophilum]